MNYEQKVITAVDGLASWLVKKNEQYGNSALEPVRVFSDASQVEQILVRMDDKLSRLARGNASMESDRDVERDLLGYYLLLTVYRMRKALPPQFFYVENELEMMLSDEDRERIASRRNGMFRRDVMIAAAYITTMVLNSLPARAASIGKYTRVFGRELVNTISNANERREEVMVGLLVNNMLIDNEAI